MTRHRLPRDPGPEPNASSSGFGGRYWTLNVSSFVSTVGNSFLYVAMPLALLQTTGSTGLAIMSLAAQTAPYLLSPLLGPFLDRYQQRFCFLAGELLQAVAVVACIPLLQGGNVISVYAALTLFGLGRAASDISSNYGLLPLLVKQGALERATAVFSALQLVARFIGPGLAGIVVEAAGYAWALTIDGVSFGITCFVAFLMPASRRSSGSESVVRLFAEGFRYFSRHRRLVWFTISVSLYNFGAGALEPSLISLGKGAWGWTAGAIGSAVGFGALFAAVGAWLSPRVFQNSNLTKVIGHWYTLSCLGALFLITPNPYIVLLAFAMLSLGEGGVNAATVAYRQQNVPAEVSGRVNSIIRAFVTGAIPLASLMMGYSLGQNVSEIGLWPAPLAAVIGRLAWVLFERREKQSGTV